MPIERIHTYLVHPSRGVAAQQRIGGTSVQLNGKLFDLLASVYDKSDRECNIDISFNPRPEGIQNNPCRDMLVAYLDSPTLTNGRQIANRLQGVTDNRSGLGLLFLISGTEGNEQKIVISRFPADSAILAEEDQQALTVEFLERVFMKSATAYKAALYEDSSLAAGFWIGKAVDKQINSQIAELSQYWITDFLDSDFLTTAAAGTRELATALRAAAKNSDDIAVKSELAAAVTLAGGLNRRNMSINEFNEHFGLSEPARTAVAAEVKHPNLVNEHFRFDIEEFKKYVAYRSLELDNGGILTAQASDFEDVFEREVVDEVAQTVRYSTQGRVVDQKIGKAK